MVLELFVLPMIKYVKQYLFLFSLIFIFVVSVALRFYQLGVNPPSLDWDEASLGYNAYSILKTGADEYGNKLPLTFRSFDDYKPPVYVYLTVPSVSLFGLNEFAVRLPSALLGVIGIFATFFLVRELLKNTTIAFLSAFFLAISPWHLQFSRTAFEGNVGLTFFLLGALFFLRGTKTGKPLILASIFFILASYSYHSFRLIVPLFIFISAIVFRKELIAYKKFALAFFIILTVLSIPIAQNIFSPQGVSSRLSMVTIFGSDQLLEKSINRIEYDKKHGDFIGSVFHNRRVAYSMAVIKGYLDHWNPDFLFLHGDGGRQHHGVDVGMLYLWELPLILFGIYTLLQKMDKKTLIIFVIFLLAPLPSAITTGTPHPVRAIAMIPVFHIFTAVGIFTFFRRMIEINALYKKVAVVSVVGFFGFLNFAYYMHQYYVHTPIEYGDFWQYGYKEVFSEALKRENEYEKIIVTYKYDQPYIYYLFYNKIDPVWYQNNWQKTEIERMNRVIGKYEFRNINWSKDKNLQNTLLIGTPDEFPHNKNYIKEIKFLDGTTAFKIIKT